jgi:hypothetical protein
MAFTEEAPDLAERLKLANKAKSQAEDRNSRINTDRYLSSSKESTVPENSTHSSISSSNFSENQRDTKDTLIKLIKKGRETGRNTSADLLQHYVDGSGEAVTLDTNFVRTAPGVIDGEARVQSHF